MFQATEKILKTRYKNYHNIQKGDLVLIVNNGHEWFYVEKIGDDKKLKELCAWITNERFNNLKVPIRYLKQPSYLERTSESFNINDFVFKKMIDNYKERNNVK